MARVIKRVNKYLNLKYVCVIGKTANESIDLKCSLIEKLKSKMYAKITKCKYLKCTFNHNHYFE